MKVVTESGTVLADGSARLKKGEKMPPEGLMEEDEAKARCKQANADAEAMGLKVRYKVEG